MVVGGEGGRAKNGLVSWAEAHCWGSSMAETDEEGSAPKKGLLCSGRSGRMNGGLELTPLLSCSCSWLARAIRFWMKAISSSWEPLAFSSII